MYVELCGRGRVVPRRESWNEWETISNFEDLREDIKGHRGRHFDDGIVSHSEDVCDWGGLGERWDRN